MRVNELAVALRKRGLTVIEVAGWQTRGYEFPARSLGALRHWTAGPATGDTPCLGVVTNGRSDLPGPLCNVYQSRRVDTNGIDIVYAIASGKANHAGSGAWNGVSGNYKLLGLEIEWSGPNEAFANVRRRKLTSELVMRALIDCCSGANPAMAAEHREYAPTRKIDTNLSGQELRQRLADIDTGDDDVDEATLKAAIRDVLNEGTGVGFTGATGWGDTVKETLKLAREAFNNANDIAVALDDLPARIVAALPPANSGGITKADVQAAAEAAIVKRFGGIFEGI